MEENGNTIRAEFIRLGVELEKYVPSAFPEKRARYETILRDHLDALVPANVARLLAGGHVQIDWRRGFPECARIRVVEAGQRSTWNALEELGTLTDVTLTWNRNDGMLERGRHAAAFIEMGRSKNAANLKRLTARQVELEFLTGFELAHYPKLEELDFAANHLHHIPYLTRGNPHPNLRRLSLWQNSLNRDDVTRILGSTAFPNLHDLRLEGNTVEYHPAEELPTVALTQLKNLSIDFHDVHQLIAFFGTSAFKRMHTLTAGTLGDAHLVLPLDGMIRAFRDADPQKLLSIATPWGEFHNAPAVREILNRNLAHRACNDVVSGLQ